MAMRYIQNQEMLNRRSRGVSRLLRSVVLALVVATSPLAAVDVAQGKGATGITTADGYLDELGLIQAMGRAILSNCYLETIRLDGIDFCTSSGWPRFCFRIRNNKPVTILEATGKRQHVSVITIATEAFLELWTADQKAMPSSKKLGQDITGGGTGSSRAMARTLGVPLTLEALMAAASTVSLGNLCQPESFSLAYYYFGEGDETRSTKVWLSIISGYYLNRMTAPLSWGAVMVEGSGLCRLDTNWTLCFGGYGKKYPTRGDITASSPALATTVMMWRGNEITAGTPAQTGPYSTSLGPIVHGQLHLPASIAASAGSYTWPYSPGSYVQWLYPGTGSLPVGVPDTSCYLLGTGSGTDFQEATQMMNEFFNKTWMEEMSLAYAYWVRTTCCNYCRGSDQEAAKNMTPEQSFAPRLSRRP